MNSLAPLTRLARLYYYLWARHDLQRQGKHCDPDMAYIINKIAELRG